MKNPFGKDKGGVRVRVLFSPTEGFTSLLMTQGGNIIGMDITGCRTEVESDPVELPSLGQTECGVTKRPRIDTI